MYPHPAEVIAQPRLEEVAHGFGHGLPTGFQGANLSLPVETRLGRPPGSLLCLNQPLVVCLMQLTLALHSEIWHAHHHMRSRNCLLFVAILRSMDGQRLTGGEPGLD
jgi:hypothetical protein